MTVIVVGVSNLLNISKKPRLIKKTASLYTIQQIQETSSYLYTCENQKKKKRKLRQSMEPFKHLQSM